MRVPRDRGPRKNEEIKLSDFLKADERLTTSGCFTLEEIEEEVVSLEGLSALGAL